MAQSILASFVRISRYLVGVVARIWVGIAQIGVWPHKSGRGPKISSRVLNIMQYVPGCLLTNLATMMLHACRYKCNLHVICAKVNACFHPNYACNMHVTCARFHVGFEHEAKLSFILGYKNGQYQIDYHTNIITSHMQPTC